MDGTIRLKLLLSPTGGTKRTGSRSNGKVKRRECKNTVRRDAFEGMGVL